MSRTQAMARLLSAGTRSSNGLGWHHLALPPSLKILQPQDLLLEEKQGCPRKAAPKGGARTSPNEEQLGASLPALSGGWISFSVLVALLYGSINFYRPATAKALEV